LPTWQTLLRALAVSAFYGFSFWRIVKSNRGNKVIESGSLALMVVVVLAVLMKIPNMPDWVLASIGLLLFLLCLLTMGFLFQQGFRAFRRRFRKSN